MKKTGIAALCLCCLLCGCGSGETEVQALQQQYAQVQKAQMEAEITCHLEQENRSFTVQCIYDREEGATTTVTKPEALAGISVSCAADTLSVDVDGTVLPVGEMTDVSPANCLPWLLQAAREGYVLDYGQETVEDTECLRVALDTTGENGKVLCTAWFDRQTLTPQYIEFSREEQVVLSVKMLSFTWEGQ